MRLTPDDPTTFDEVELEDAAAWVAARFSDPAEQIAVLCLAAKLNRLNELATKEHTE